MNDVRHKVVNGVRVFLTNLKDIKVVKKVLLISSSPWATDKTFLI